MSKIPFRYYLHDESFAELFDFTFRDTELANLSEDEKDALLQKIGRPFYEMTLKCELDTETGEVTLLEARL
jgi:hypothetical protein